MPGLQSTQQTESTTGPSAETGPQLRVVAADSDGEFPMLGQFEAALASGDLSRARDALLGFRDEQQAERDRLQQEKAQLVAAVEDLQQLFDERCRAHEEDLCRQKEELASWHDQEKQGLARQSEEAASEINRAREELEDRIRKWEAERDKEAALLAEERSHLDTERRELADQKAEFEAAMAGEQQERIRMADEMISQREGEWVERQKQLEQELKSQRLLHEKQIKLDRESFLQACSQREAELDAKRAEMEKQRRGLVDDRCRTAERFAETRRQLEHDRSLVQEGLRQMEAQLRWVSSNLSLCGTTPVEDDPSTPGHSQQAASQLSGSDVEAPDLATATRDSVVATESTLNDGESGWAGIVCPREEESEESAERAAESLPPAPEVLEPSEPSVGAEMVSSGGSDADRRARIDEYRSQLANLQASLSSLQSGAAVSPADSVEDNDEPDIG